MAPHPTYTSTSQALNQHQASRALKLVNPKKAAGPDRVPGKTLKQLSGVQTEMVNL